MSVNVAIINSGGSNLRSVVQAVDRLNKSYVITDTANEIKNYSMGV